MVSQKPLEHRERSENSPLDGASLFSCQEGSQGNWTLKLGPLGGWDETGIGHITSSTVSCTDPGSFSGNGFGLKMLRLLRIKVSSGSGKSSLEAQCFCEERVVPGGVELKYSYVEFACEKRMKPNTSDRGNLKEGPRLEKINLGLKGQNNIEGKSQIGQMEVLEMGMTMIGSKLQ